MKLHTTGLDGSSQTSKSASNLSLPKLNGGNPHQQHPTRIGLNWVPPEFDGPIIPGPGFDKEDLEEFSRKFDFLRKLFLRKLLKGRVSI